MIAMCCLLFRSCCFSRPPEIVHGIPEKLPVSPPRQSQIFAAFTSQ